MWDKESGQCIWKIVEEMHNDDFPSMAISSSGKKTVIWGISVCQVHDTSLGMIISCWSIELQQMRTVAFSPDEDKIIAILIHMGQTVKETGY
jgi:hypothetical protein